MCVIVDVDKKLSINLLIGNYSLSAEEAHIEVVIAKHNNLLADNVVGIRATEKDEVLLAA